MKKIGWLDKNGHELSTSKDMGSHKVIWVIPDNSGYEALAFGTELEYADDVTLTRAIEGRQEF